MTFGSLFGLLAMGIFVGIAFNRNARGWLARVGAVGDDKTAALIGIAGAFVGFHLAGAAGWSQFFLQYLTAVLGVLLAGWMWRGH